MHKQLTKGEIQRALCDAWRKAASDFFLEAAPQPYKLAIHCTEDPWTLTVSIEDEKVSDPRIESKREGQEL